MPEDRYFQLNDDVGLDHEGNPQPLHEIGLAISVPTMQGGEIVEIPQRQTLKPIPGTRTFKTGDPLIASQILDAGLFHEIDPPKQADIKAERKTTQDARENAGTVDPEPEA